MSAKTVNVADAEVYVRSACRWVKRHGVQFKRIMHLIHLRVDSDAVSVQRGDIFILARQAEMDITDCEELKRNNNLWASLARYMVMLRPCLARVLHFRDAGCDHVDMQAIWREEVNAETVFLAENWKAAKRACEEGCVSAA